MTDPTPLDLLAAHEASVVVGVLTTAGEPLATRCWGVRVLSHAPPRVRLLLPADAVASMGRSLGDGGHFPLAVTSADVRTLVSRQCKGIASNLEEAGPDDLELSHRYIERFLATINRTDGYDTAVLERWPPPDLVRCDLEIEAVFDQTPGPGAGAPVRP